MTQNTGFFGEPLRRCQENTRAYQILSFIYLSKDVYVYTVTQSCLTLCEHIDCRPPSSSVHEISQARTLKWAAFSYSNIKRCHTSNIWHCLCQWTLLKWCIWSDMKQIYYQATRNSIHFQASCIIHSTNIIILKIMH